MSSRCPPDALQMQSLIQHDLLGMLRPQSLLSLASEVSVALHSLYPMPLKPNLPGDSGCRGHLTCNFDMVDDAHKVQTWNAYVALQQTYQ